MQSINKILVTNFHKYERNDINLPDERSEQILFNLNDMQWKNQRQFKSTVFTTKRLKAFYQIVDKCCQQFSKVIEKQWRDSTKSNEYILMKEYSKLTMDIFLQCTLSLNIDIYSDSMAINDLLMAANKVANNVKYSELFSRMPTFANKWLKLIAFDTEKSMKTFENILEHYIDLRRSANGKSDDIMSIYLDQMQQGNYYVEFLSSIRTW